MTAPVRALSNLLADARARLDREIHRIRALIAKPDKTAADYALIGGLAASFAFIVLFVVGPITGTALYLLGKGISRG